MHKLRHNRKGGISVAIAMIMAMVIVFSLVMNIFNWEQILRNEDSAKADESFQITNVHFDGSNLNITVQNSGLEVIHFTALWIDNNRTSINYFLNINQEGTFSNTTKVNVTTNDIFKLTLVSERGSLAEAQYVPIPTPDVQASGVFRVDWFYCKYTSRLNSSSYIPPKKDLVQLTMPYSSGFPSTTKGDKYVAFYLSVTNNWIFPVTIKNQSSLTLVIWETDPMFSIVKNASYSGTTPTLTSYTDSNQITLNPTQSAELVFAAGSNGKPVPSSSSWQWDTSFPYTSPSAPDQSEAAQIQISLFYTLNGYSTRMFGQTLTAQAIYLVHV